MAVNHPLIKTFEDKDLQNSLLVLIGKTHLSCGQKFNQDLTELANATVDELASDLKKYNANLSFQEITLAFKNGYKGDYGEYFGLNNKTYFQWINAYAYGEKRLRVKKLLSDAKEKANKPTIKLSEQEANEIIKQAILKSFEDFKKGAVVLDIGNVKYNYLEKLELINFSKERKNEILEKTKDRLKSDAIEHKQKTESISQCLSKIMNETIVSEAKKECLRIYFKELVETEFEISDLL